MTAVIPKVGEGGRADSQSKIDTTTQSDTSDEVLSMLLEAIELYQEEFPMAPRCFSVMNGFEIALSEMPRCRHFEDTDKTAPRFHERLF